MFYAMRVTQRLLLLFDCAGMKAGESKTSTNIGARSPTRAFAALPLRMPTSCDFREASPISGDFSACLGLRAYLILHRIAPNLMEIIAAGAKWRNKGKTSRLICLGPVLR
jgi:hypothetical protein